MNHETTIKRIQELVPDVMELEFGCEVFLYSEEYSKYRRILKVLDKRNVVGMDTIVEVCENYSNGVSSVFYNEKNKLKIIGKPITLAVVLMALDSSPGIRPLTEGMRLVVEQWIWEKDNFNDQSEETKTFIGGLLK